MDETIRHRFVLAALIGLAASCDGSPAPPANDVGPITPSDARPADAGALDALPHDAEDAPADSAVLDAAALDATSIDATVSDAATADSGAADSGVDAGAEPAGPCPGPPPASYTFTAGVAAFGDDDLIEYVPGDLPIIISAPHGGTLEPAGFAVDPSSLSRDGGSREAALLVHRYLGEVTGRTPHLIINHVTRNRLNLNRSDARPNETLPAAVQAWTEFHEFIEAAKGWVSAACSKGHYFDFHTNGHDERWVEIGVALTGSQLAPISHRFSKRVR